MHFLFRLALQLRVDHPGQLASRLTPEQLADWWLYYQCDPWGDQRADYRAFFAARAAYVEEATPDWPYIEPGFTAEELREATGA